MGCVSDSFGDDSYERLRGVQRDGQRGTFAGCDTRSGNVYRRMTRAYDD